MKASYWADSQSEFIDSETVQNIRNNRQYITIERFMKLVAASDVNNIAKQLGYYVGKQTHGARRLRDDVNVLYYTSSLGDTKLYVMSIGDRDFIFAKEAA